MILSWIAYIVSLIYMHYSTSVNSTATYVVVFCSLRFYMSFIFIVGLNFLIDLTTNNYKAFFNNSLAQELKILIKKITIFDDESQLVEEDDEVILKWVEKLKEDTMPNEEIESENKEKKNKKRKTNTKDLEKIDRVSLEKIESHSQERLNHEEKYSPVQIKE